MKAKKKQNRVRRAEHHLYAKVFVCMWRHAFHHKVHAILHYLAPISLVFRFFFIRFILYSLPYLFCVNRFIFLQSLQATKYFAENMLLGGDQNMHSDFTMLWCGKHNAFLTRKKWKICCTEKRLSLWSGFTIVFNAYHYFACCVLLMMMNFDMWSYIKATLVHLTKTNLISSNLVFSIVKIFAKTFLIKTCKCSS